MRIPAVSVGRPAGSLPLLILVLAAALAAGACSPNVFLETVKWFDEGDGLLTYRTNDPDELEMSAWRLDGNVQALDGYTVETTARKVSGSPSTGFGIVFCAQDDDNFYRVLVSVNGNFGIHKRVAGLWSTVLAWSPSGVLNEG